MVERYDKARHLELVREWYVGHGWDPVAEDELPPLGWVSDCCAFWAFLTDTSIALIENLIADPKAHPRRVLRALGEMESVARGTLRDLGVKKTLSYTFSPLASRFFAGVPGAERHRKPFTMYRVTL